MKHTKCGLHVRRTSAYRHRSLSPGRLGDRIFCDVAPKGCRRFLISTQPTTDVRERLAVPSRCHSWIVNRDTLHSSHPWHSTQRAAEGSLKRKATCGPRVGLGLHRITAVQSCQPPHQQEKRAHAGSSLTLEPSQAAFRGPSFRTLSMSLVCCRESLCQTKSSGIISTRAGSTGYPSTKCDALQRSFATASSRAWLIDSPSMMTAPPSRNVSHHSVISVPPRCSEDPGQPIRVKAGSSRKSPRPRTRLINSAWADFGRAWFFSMISFGTVANRPLCDGSATPRGLLGSLHGARSQRPSSRLHQSRQKSLNRFGAKAV
jgi:hypothetical protein